MTKPINEMTPLEIREAVAVEIMGEPAHLYTPYESYIGCAFEVVEKMREKGCDMTLTQVRLRQGASLWGCEINPFAGPHEGAEFTAHGATAALAICKAALEAVRATK